MLTGCLSSGGGGSWRSDNVSVVAEEDNVAVADAQRRPSEHGVVRKLGALRQYNSCTP
jgi:hypothetical protein